MAGSRSPGSPVCRKLSEETLADLKLALTEACSNSVRHAYRDGREGTVEIVYELRPDRLDRSRSTYDGPGFDYSKGPRKPMTGS